MKKGLLIIYSGPSAVGKDTLLKELLNDSELKIALSVSMTTRAPRNGEKEGVDYFYVSNERFEEAIKNNELLEYAKYVDHYYGTPLDYVEKNRNEGKNVVLVIEIDGSQHFEESGLKHDSIRTEYLEKFDLMVIRIPNNEIRHNFSGVCDYIDHLCLQKKD